MSISKDSEWFNGIVHSYNVIDTLKYNNDISKYQISLNDPIYNPRTPSMLNSDHPNHDRLFNPETTRKIKSIIDKYVKVPTVPPRFNVYTQDSHQEECQPGEIVAAEFTSPLPMYLLQDEMEREIVD
jgi:hypothetical protein